MKEALVKYWKYVAGAFLAVVGLFLYQRNRIEGLEADQASSQNTLDNAVTDAKVDSVDKQLEEEKKKAEAAKENVSEEQVLDYLKKL